MSRNEFMLELAKSIAKDYMQNKYGNVSFKTVKECADIYEAAMINAERITQDNFRV